MQDKKQSRKLKRELIHLQRKQERQNKHILSTFLN
jgi:hypothetical protein